MFYLLAELTFLLGESIYFFVSFIFYSQQNINACYGGKLLFILASAIVPEPCYHKVQNQKVKMIWLW